MPDVDKLKKFEDQLLTLSKSYLKYSDFDDHLRRKLVTQSRQLLVKINQSVTKSLEISRPVKLKLNTNNNSKRLLPRELKLSSNLLEINGIGVNYASKFSVLGLFFIRDLLEYFPRDYVDYSSVLHIKDLEIGETSTIVATVKRCNTFVSHKNKNLSILELILYDHTGKIKVSRFFAGKRFSSFSYLKSQANLYPPGTTVAVSGLVKNTQYGKVLNDPIIESIESPNSFLKSRKIGRLLPIYQLTEGLTADRVRELIDMVLPLANQWRDPLPRSLRNKLSLLSKAEAIKEIHQPTNNDMVTKARRRLVFDEFLFMQLGLLRKRNEVQQRVSPSFNIINEDGELLSKFYELLPFKFTAAQSRVFTEIDRDLNSSKPMARLVQGDVGSGKTVVALSALLRAVEAGWQGALMAPTEVLANQHYSTLCRWLTQLHVNVELLTGSTTRTRRRSILEDLSNGAIKIIVGTHALIEDSVNFNRLGLVVVDEQHRFGVHQRNRLLSKGLQPHLLTMTATPIPRTLALSLYGDLDVSQIDELPPGRTPIKTRLLSNRHRPKAYSLIREEIEKGQQAYMVLPLIEDSEKLDLRSAIAVHKHLKEEVFKDFNVGLLHGKMSSSDKQEIIQNFVKGICQILVSTTVIEVGVDVPSATVMLIENADRFGLAQLHQLRGRVGRGAKQSYCLIINESNNSISKQRLEVLEKLNDGFQISEIDLQFRGPGQVLGTRQSGLPDFALASLAKDGEILDLARNEAMEILKQDPELRIFKTLKIAFHEYSLKYNRNLTLN